MAGQEPSEEWRPVKGYEGRYEVSDLGRVRGPRAIRKPCANYKGYRYVSLWLRGRRKNMKIARLVLSTFVCARPNGMESAHLNGDRSDDRLQNLAWVTSSENEAHKRAHGTALLGESANGAKLTESIVRAAREEHRARGTSGTQLAKMYGVNQTTMCRLLRGTTWGHVK